MKGLKQSEEGVPAVSSRESPFVMDDSHLAQCEREEATCSTPFNPKRERSLKTASV